MLRMARCFAPTVPTTLRVDEEETFLEGANLTFKVSNSRLLGSIGSLESLRRAFALVANSPWRPDVVFFLRPDLLFACGLNVAASLSVRAGELLLPAANSFGGLPDQLAVAQFDEAARYSYRSDDLPYSSIHHNYSAERHLKLTVETHRLKVWRAEFKYYILRSNRCVSNTNLHYSKDGTIGYRFHPTKLACASVGPTQPFIALGDEPCTSPARSHQPCLLGWEELQRLAGSGGEIIRGDAAERRAVEVLRSARCVGQGAGARCQGARTSGG